MINRVKPGHSRAQAGLGDTFMGKIHDRSKTERLPLRQAILQAADRCSPRRDDQTTAPPVVCFSFAGFNRSSRFTPSHMATAAATNTDE